ncbi:uncharacterized protein MKZ38_006063 [Zalerion maritima]|uniref:DNA topoisomerase (ATP-hydrolyzing) n=1 Tax=Zalerion maritima TaxID=339359 RepID=A0AAD5RJJ8_9PEZI|nr:uncharacterized protein MKZ38_006063 [Zalerion maritima]
MPPALLPSLAGSNLVDVPASDQARRGATICKLADLLRDVRVDLALVRFLRICKLALSALCSGTVITKRNIFYQDKDLFRSQVIVDKLVDDLACTLGVERHFLNIVAAGKGLVTGPITLFAVDDTVKDCADPNGILIPPMENISQIDFRHAKWVLVIEKEATFTTLAQFLSAVRKMMPSLPIYAIVDFDPDGISIMRMYRYGSRNLAHEDGAVEDLEWLGIRSKHILTRTAGQGGAEGGGRIAAAPRQEGNAVTTKNTRDRGRGQASQQESTSSQETFPPSSQDSVAVPQLPRRLRESGPHRLSRSQSQAEMQVEMQAPGGRIEDTLLTLTSRDRKRAVVMLNELSVGRDGDIHDPRTMECARELHVMMMLNVKAEIQAVDRMGNMTDWLDEHLVLGE